MTVWCPRMRYHAVGIHVSRPPDMSQNQSNGRVEPRVHLRIRRIDHVLRLFGTVLTMFEAIWHCFDLRDMDIDLRDMDIDLRDMDMGPGYGTLYVHMGPCTCIWDPVRAY